mgnify:CR=1 FL=1
MKDKRIYIRVTEEMKETLRLKAGERGISEYIEGLIERDLEGVVLHGPSREEMIDLKSMVNSFATEKFTGTSSTSEQQRKQVDRLPVSSLLDLGMEELHEDKEPMIEYNDDYSQGRVVGRHKK